MFDLTDTKTISGHYTTMRDVIVRTVDDIDEAYKTKGTLRGIPSGFQKLDEMTGGFQASDYVVIYGSQGIRFFTLSMAAHICVNQKIPAAYFSLGISDVF